MRCLLLFILILAACTNDPVSPVIDRRGDYVQTFENLTFTIRIEQNDPRITHILCNDPYLQDPYTCDSGEWIRTDGRLGFEFHYTWTDGNMTGRLWLAAKGVYFEKEVIFERQ